MLPDNTLSDNASRSALPCYFTSSNIRQSSKRVPPFLMHIVITTHSCQGVNTSVHLLEFEIFKGNEGGREGGREGQCASLSHAKIGGKHIQ